MKLQLIRAVVVITISAMAIFTSHRSADTPWVDLKGYFACVTIFLWLLTGLAAALI